MVSSSLFLPVLSQAPLTPRETHSISWGPKRMAEKESSGAGVETPRVEAAPRQPGRGEVRDGTLTCLPGLGLPAPKNPRVLPPQLPVSFPAFLLPSQPESTMQSAPWEKFQLDLAPCGAGRLKMLQNDPFWKGQQVWQQSAHRPRALPS